MRIDNSSFKKKALEFLGRAYNSHTGILTEQIFEDLEETNVNVAPINSGYSYEYVQYADKPVESQENKFTVGFTLGGLSATLERTTGSSSLSSDETNTYTIRKCIVNRCQLTGKLRNKKPVPTIAECNYLQSCQLTVGYSVTVKMQRVQLQKNEKKPAYNLRAVLRCFNLDYHGGSFEKLSDNEYFKITIKFAGIGGFNPPLAELNAKDFSEQTLIKIDAVLGAQIPKLLMQLEYDTGDDLMPFPANEVTIPKNPKDGTEPPPLFPILDREGIRALKPLDEKELKSMAIELTNHLPEKMKQLNITKMLTLLQDVIKQIPTTTKPIILVLGKTSAGKSTLICSLMGIPLKPGYNSDLQKAYVEISPDYKDIRPHPHIGQLLDLGTAVPAIYEIDQRHIADCPGFFDIRGTEADLINYMALRILINLSGGVRGIIVVIDSKYFLDKDLAGPFGSSKDRLAGGLSQLPADLKEIVYDPAKIVKAGYLKFVITKTSGSEAAKDIIKKQLKIWFGQYSYSTKIVRKIKNKAIDLTSGIAPSLEEHKSEIPMDEDWGEANEFLKYFRKKFDENVFLSDLKTEKTRLLPLFSGRSQLIENKEIDLTKYSTEIKPNTKEYNPNIKDFILAVIYLANEKGDKRAKLYSEINSLEHEISWILTRLENDQFSFAKHIKDALRQKESAIETLKLIKNAVDNGFDIYLRYPEDDEAFGDQLETWESSESLSNSLAGKVLFIQKPSAKLWHVYFMNRKNELSNKVIPSGSYLETALKNKEEKDHEKLKVLLYHAQLFETFSLWPGLICLKKRI